MGNSLVLGDPPIMLRCRFRDRILAHVFGASLDASLASGSAPESSRILAARAQDIVALPRREAMAGDWEHLLLVARRAARIGGGRAASRRAASRAAVLVCADRIVAAELAIRELICRLSAPLPVPARGVAMARILLTDATGPVYNRRSRVSLTAALYAAVAQLDPALPLTSCAP